MEAQTQKEGMDQLVKPLHVTHLTLSELVGNLVTTLVLGSAKKKKLMFFFPNCWIFRLFATFLNKIF